MWILDFIYKPTSPALKFAPGLKEKFKAIEKPYQKTYIVKEGDEYSFRHEPGTGLIMLDFPYTPEGQLSKLTEVDSKQMFEFLKIIFHNEYPETSLELISECIQIIEIFIRQAKEEIPYTIAYVIDPKEKPNYPESDINPVFPKKEYIRLINGFYKKYICCPYFGSITAKVHAVCFLMLPYLKNLERKKTDDSSQGREINVKAKHKGEKPQSNDCNHFLTKDGLKLIPYLKKEISIKTKPLRVTEILFALDDLSLLESSLASFEAIELYRVLGSFLPINFHKEGLRVRIISFREGDPKYRRAVEKEKLKIKAFFEELNNENK